MTANAVTFELLKLATIKLFEQLEGQAHIRKVDDKTRTATVQYTIKVKCQEANYTINIYTTTSRLMINGPGANYFLSNDMVAIHRIIIDSLREEGIKKLNIDQVNRDLGQQLEQLLNNVDINKMNKNHETVETGDTTCPKCNKKCRTRSTYCTDGQHWVHYKCQKLTNQEIQEIENSKSDDQYQCKLCMEQRGSVNLAIKGPIIAKPTAQDHAQQLLDEELTLTSTRSDSLADDFYECVICDNMVIEPDGQICCICSSLCHNKCLTELDEIYTCVACVANNESINQLKRTINDANMFSALDHTTDTEETLVKQPSDDIQTSSKPIPKPRKAKRGETTRNKTADEPKTKLSEIRTREIKLRKRGADENERKISI